MANRPEYYPYHDELLSNIELPQDSDYIFSGYPVGLAVPSADHNGKLNSAGRWHAYHDQGTLQNEDWTDSNSQFALTLSPLAYGIGGNVLTAGQTTISRGAYLFEGVRLETNDALLNPIGVPFQGSPLKFPGATAPGRLWVYVQKSGQVRIESVAVGVVDSPAANEMSLVGVDIDGLGVVTDGNVSPTTAPLPNYELGITIPLILGGGPSTPLVIQDVPLGYVGAYITGPGDAFGLVVDGDTFSAAAFTSSAAGDGVAMLNTGSGRALHTTANTATSCTLRVEQLGAGCAAQIDSNGSGTTVEIENLSTGSALTTRNNGALTTIATRNLSTGSALEATNGNVTAPTIKTANLGGGPALEVANGVLVVNAGGEFNNGAPTNFRDTVNVLGAAGGALTSDATAVCTWVGIATFTGRCNVDTTTSTTAGDLSKDASGNLEYRDVSATKKVHVSASGYFKGYGHSTVDGAAATISVDTSASVAPIVASTIDVSATAWVQRAAAGDITVSLVALGVGQIGTSNTITLPAKVGSNFFPISFSRPHAASTTPRKYRFFIDGNGSNVNAVTTKVIAEPGSSA